MRTEHGIQNTEHQLIMDKSLTQGNKTFETFLPNYITQH